MAFARRRNRLRTHSSECIPVVKRRMTVLFSVWCSFSFDITISVFCLANRSPVFFFVGAIPDHHIHSSLRTANESDLECSATRSKHGTGVFRKELGVFGECNETMLEFQRARYEATALRVAPARYREVTRKYIPVRQIFRVRRDIFVPNYELPWDIACKTTLLSCTAILEGEKPSLYIGGWGVRSVLLVFVIFILIIKTNEIHYFSNLFWQTTLHVSDRLTVHHQES